MISILCITYSQLCYNLSMNKAFIFDMDGVIINSEQVWLHFEKNLLDHLLGKELNQKIGSKIGFSVNTIYERAVEFGFSMPRKDFQKAYDQVAFNVYARADITPDIDK